MVQEITVYTQPGKIIISSYISHGLVCKALLDLPNYEKWNLKYICFHRTLKSTFVMKNTFAMKKHICIGLQPGYLKNCHSCSNSFVTFPCNFNKRWEKIFHFRKRAERNTAILKDTHFFSFTSDGSTDIAGDEQESIFVRTAHNG